MSALEYLQREKLYLPMCDAAHFVNFYDFAFSVVLVKSLALLFKPPCLVCSGRFCDSNAVLSIFSVCASDWSLLFLVFSWVGSSRVFFSVINLLLILIGTVSSTASIMDFVRPFIL